MHFMPRRILIGSTFGSTDVRMEPWGKRPTDHTFPGASLRARLSLSRGGSAWLDVVRLCVARSDACAGTRDSHHRRSRCACEKKCIVDTNCC